MPPAQEWSMEIADKRSLSAEYEYAAELGEHHIAQMTEAIVSNQQAIDAALHVYQTYCHHLPGACPQEIETFDSAIEMQLELHQMLENQLRQKTIIWTDVVEIRSLWTEMEDSDHPCVMSAERRNEICRKVAFYCQHFREEKKSCREIMEQLEGLKHNIGDMQQALDLVIALLTHDE